MSVPINQGAGLSGTRTRPTARLLIVLSASVLLAADHPAQQKAALESVLQATREIMAAAEYCFLITLDASGQPQARLMNPFQAEGDLTVWMGTSSGTRKVEQLRNDPRATLAYYDAAGMSYVTLIGKARLVDELEERSRRWKPEWESFYPDGPTSADYVLIEFVPTRVEVMSVARDVGAGAFAPAILERKGSFWVLQ